MPEESDTRRQALTGKVKEGAMHYHVRLDKVGCADDGQSFGFERKDFRSLEALLGWAQKAYGDGADGWSVMGMDGLYDRATKL